MNTTSYPGELIKTCAPRCLERQPTVLKVPGFPVARPVLCVICIRRSVGGPWAVLSEAETTFGPALISHTIAGLSYSLCTYLTFHQSACQAVHSGRAITWQGHRSQARPSVVTEIRDGIMARIGRFLSVSIWLAFVLLVFMFVGYMRFFTNLWIPTCENMYHRNAISVQCLSHAV